MEERDGEPGRSVLIPKECKRLAEVDFPIAEVGTHALAEKSRRTGTPHQLHLWWAWRPLAACRSMLLGLLLPDPCDPLCPSGFKETATEVIAEIRHPPTTDKDLQKALLWFIGSFASFDLAANEIYVRVARDLVEAAHPNQTPLIADPFAGGGSIPLEALRLGCDAVASDLNPVATAILKVKLEDIPRHGLGIADELRLVGAEIRDQAQKELAYLYPRDPDGATPIAYLWARTVRCESPNCGAEIPLIRSFWLSKKPNRKRALKPIVTHPSGKPPQIDLGIYEPNGDAEVHAATVSRAKATCLNCGVVLPPVRVRAQLADQRGGADVIFDEGGKRIGGARLLAVVTVKPAVRGRHYRLPTELDLSATHAAHLLRAKMTDDWERDGRSGPCPVPDEPTPRGGGSGAGRAFNLHKYGMLQWGDLFTARQVVALSTLSGLVDKVPNDAVRDLTALSLSKLAERNNVICDWMVGVECPGHLFTQQVIPPAWDFAEATPLGESSGSFALVIEGTAKNAIACVTGSVIPADVGQYDAADFPLPDESVDVYFTDPPYYDAVPYSDLSDFFYVWLKRGLKSHSFLQDPFNSQNPLSPKAREIVEDETREFEGEPKDGRFFEARLSKAFKEGNDGLKPDGIACIVFAHKTTEGWEALLTGIIEGGWVITSSWPITTERSARMRARNSAALASSIHLVCRPRPEEAPVGDWADVLGELPTRVSAWMERLQGEGVRGADLIFACIGPALEVFSRYSRVETAEGNEINLPEFLEKVWEVVGKAALSQILGGGNGSAAALEEDARLTALFLWTLQATRSEDLERDGNRRNGGVTDEANKDEASAKRKSKGPGLIYDVVRRFAQPLGIHLEDWEDRVITTQKGIVRLIPISDRAEQLFGKGGAQAVADEIEKGGTGPLQLALFSQADDLRESKVSGRRGRNSSEISDESLRARRQATTLDRVHAAMLLQKVGRANALRAVLQDEAERGSEFTRLANALSALYPTASEEKRLVDAMLLAAPR